MAEREQVFIKMLAIMVKHSNEYFLEHYSIEEIFQDISSYLSAPSVRWESSKIDNQSKVDALQIEYRHKIEAAVGFLEACKRTISDIFIGDQDDGQISASLNIDSSSGQQREQIVMSADVKNTKVVTNSFAEEKTATSAVVTQDNDPVLGIANGEVDVKAKSAEVPVPNTDGAKLAIKVDVVSDSTNQSEVKLELMEKREDSFSSGVVSNPDNVMFVKGSEIKSEPTLKVEAKPERSNQVDDCLATEVVTDSEKTVHYAIMGEQSAEAKCIPSLTAKDKIHAPFKNEDVDQPKKALEPTLKTAAIDSQQGDTANVAQAKDDNETKASADRSVVGAVANHEPLTDLVTKPNSTEAVNPLKEKAVMTMTDSNVPPASTFDAEKLWNNIKSNPNLPHHKEDQDSKYFDVNDTMRLIAASVRGRSHAHKGLHRDDDFMLHHPDSDGWSILAVADGAGSCEFSRRGSQIAVQKSVETLRETLNSPLGQELLDNFPRNELERTDEKKKIVQDALYKTLVAAGFAASEEIKKEASNGGNPAKLYSTTLLMAAHKQTKDGHVIISFWVGDGAIALYQEDGELELLGQPDGGEYAGQTRFLDDRIFRDPAVVSRLRICWRDDFTALILATDGISDPLFASDSQLAQKEPWDNMWHELSPIVNEQDGRIAKEKLVKWAGFYSSGNHDDRTIALLINRKAGSHD